MKQNLLKSKKSVKNILNTPILYIINIFLIVYLITQTHSSSKITLTLINTSAQGKIISDSFKKYVLSESFTNSITALGQTITLELKTNFECCQRLFSGVKIIKEIDMNSFTTNSITTTYYMFEGCSNLQVVNLTNFNTSLVTNMQHMFCGCSGLQVVDLTNFNNSSTPNMDYMFHWCSNLNILYFPNLNTFSYITKIYFFIIYSQIGT